MRTIRRIVMAMALVVSATLIAPAGAAHAASYGGVLICFDIWKGEYYPCGTIHLPIKELEGLGEPPWGPECDCPPRIDIRINDPRDVLGPDDLLGVLDGLNHGFELLVEARSAEDPEPLRRDAGEVFRGTAELLGDAELDVGLAGYFDPERNESYGHPAMVPVGESFVAGTRTMQQAVHDPAHIDEGVDHFNDMIDQFTKLHQG